MSYPSNIGHFEIKSRAVSFSAIRDHQYFVETRTVADPETQHIWRRISQEEARKFGASYTCIDCVLGHNGINAVTLDESHISHFCGKELVRVAVPLTNSGKPVDHQGGTRRG